MSVDPSRRLRRCSFVWVLALIATSLLSAGRPAPLAAQALHPSVRLSAPAPAVANAFNLARASHPPTVGLLHARQSAERVPGARAVVDEAVRQWELLLLGLGVPYAVLEERDLEGGLSGAYDVLVAPSAEALSRDQAAAVARFVEGGGGLVASGALGRTDAAGRPVPDGGLLRTLLSATYGARTPDEATVVLQELSGGHAATAGLPAGFRLTVNPSPALVLAMPVHATPVGRTLVLGAGGERLEGARTESALLRGRYGAGTVLWMGFHPQDVSRHPDQQQAYQALVVNALAEAAGISSVAVRPWPHGHPSATTFAVLPAVGSDLRYAQSLMRLIGVFETHDVPATFFIHADAAVRFPMLLPRIETVGEIALAGDAPGVLVGHNRGVQSDRLIRARNALGPVRSREVRGVYPPAGFFDGNTLEALRDARLHYLLAPPPHDGLVPRLATWEDDIDARRPLAEEAVPGDAAAPRRPARADVLMLPMTGRDDYTVAADLGTDAAPSTARAFLEDFHGVHAAQGHYVLPLHPEMQGLTAARAEVLATVAGEARDADSWVTTLDEAAAWWAERTQISVALTAATPDGLTVLVQNDAGQKVRGVTLDLFPGAPVPDDARASGPVARVLHHPEANRITLVLDDLLPGPHRISVSFGD